MADSDGSDAGSEYGDEGGGFDPTDLEGMSDKDRKKWEKNLQKWRLFIDFLFRHIAVVTFKYNCFEKQELPQLLVALEEAEYIRSRAKLKKGEEPRVHSYKSMKETVELLEKQKFLHEANCVKRFLDLTGRMKGISMIAGGFYKALKKGKVKGVDKIKHYLDYWKGFTSRSYDFAQLQYKNANTDTFNELEKKFLAWPTTLKTTIHLSQKFLKKCSESTGLKLLSADPKVMQMHMQAAEFVLASKLEEALFQKVVEGSKAFLSNPLITGQRSQVTSKDSDWTMPDLQDINPEMLQPISDDGASDQQLGFAHDKPIQKLSTWESLLDINNIDYSLVQPISDEGVLMELPPEPPKDKKKKKGKKGKKGKGSASSHKGKKKKKKK